MHVKSLLSGVIITYMVLCAGNFFIGNTFLFNDQTMLFALVLGSAFILALHFTQGSAFLHVSMLSILFCLYAFPRILMFLYFPELVYFPFGDGIDFTVVNQGLEYVTVGTVLLLLGIMLAAKLVGKKQFETHPAHVKILSFSPQVIFLLIVLIVTMEIFVSHGLGISPYGKLRLDTQFLNIPLQFLRVLISADTVIFIIITVFVLRKEEKSRKDTLILGFAIGCYLVYLILAGSRIGGLRLVMVFLAAWLISEGDFKVTWSKATIVFLLILTSIMTFPASTTNRLKISGSDFANFTQAQESQDPEQQITKEEHELNSFLPPVARHAIRRISNRIGLIDYAILITTSEGDTEARERYMNPAYIGKSILNWMLPGVPYSEAELNTSRVINIVYRNSTDTYVRNSGYFSEFWTVWGLGKVLFGYGGGLMAIFALGFVMQFIYCAAEHLFGRYRNYYSAWFLFIVVPVVYFSMGVDHTIYVAGLWALQIVIILSFFIGLEFIFQHWKYSRNRGTRTEGKLDTPTAD